LGCGDEYCGGCEVHGCYVMLDAAVMQCSLQAVAAQGFEQLFATSRTTFKQRN